MSSDFRLGGIVPWGRTAAEYEAFFALDDLPVASRILDCGGGPASFAAEWGTRGRYVVSADPLYAEPVSQIDAAFDVIAERMLEGMTTARHRFRWESYGSPEQVVELRRNALDSFLRDRRFAVASGRYVAARLPTLPFAEGAFDVVLCSHLLFLYSEEISLQMHVAALREMLRVAREVRVFPLIALDGRPSEHLPAAVEALAAEAVCQVLPVPFEFQLGATEMLRVTRAERPG